MERRVVITGMGIWSCIGTTLDEVRQSLFEGRSGIVFSQERKDAGFRSPICGNVPHPDLKKVLNRNVRQMMPEEAQYAYVAPVQALEQASRNPVHRQQDGKRRTRCRSDVRTTETCTRINQVLQG